MRVDLFDFDLPPERIALRPASPRDSARLLLLENGQTEDRVVRDLPDLLRAGDCLVFNDTRVIPAQLEGRRGDAKIGATLHKREGPRDWIAFVRNAKRVRIGDRIDFGADVTAIAAARNDDGSILLSFEGEEPVEVLLERAGRMPLPPYIAGKRPTDARDREDYQTMFAREEGAVAAPTAALHFTPDLIAALDARGIGHATLTLHVGAGTFLPVKADDTAEHLMHAEWGRIDAATADRLNAVRHNGGRLIAVGTTSLRLIESASGEDGVIRPVRRRHPHLHHAGLPLPRYRRPAHQLPSAPLDPVHAGQRADGARSDAGGLCPCDRRGLSLLFLRGRVAAAAISPAMPLWRGAVF
jgi:S-adenosylmethionine:tRNA ribosyltransferase-isomerase